MNHRNLNVLINRHFGQSHHRRPDPVDDVIFQVADLLKMGRADKALHLLRPSKRHHDFRLINARGVCQMRLGLIDASVNTYRTLALEPVGLSLAVRHNLPNAYKTNLATALLLKGDVTGGEQILDEIDDQDYPMIEKLRDVIAAWRQELTLWEKIEDQLGVATFHSVSLPFKPGELV
ncbi:hypothetical protein LOC68_19975 [Blastopirellula sp. JC732]|uniref:Tetratricopeptide repeat protein n=1 Tax=Blastopirellula sediminis TaxID=2894196 RepID=A0A9X1MS82_9BACT|nr:hypothetical protein [Blastopirellula sediminis]MCC9606022.1 hypothetical protein [Blastopirellula sediminis]MCC9630679.1 hypothetical protein [Blastopirellula sediminis]